MIDELEILKTILENLSAVGIKGVLAYIGYKILIAAFWLGGITYALKSILKSTVSYSKFKIEKVVADNYELKELRKRNEELNREIEDVKHCYKILKEANNEPK